MRAWLNGEPKDIGSITQFKSENLKERSRWCKSENPGPTLFRMGSGKAQFTLYEFTLYVVSRNRLIASAYSC